MSVVDNNYKLLSTLGYFDLKFIIKYINLEMILRHLVFEFRTIFFSRHYMLFWQRKQTQNEIRLSLIVFTNKLKTQQ